MHEYMFIHQGFYAFGPSGLSHILLRSTNYICLTTPIKGENKTSVLADFLIHVKYCHKEGGSSAAKSHFKIVQLFISSNIFWIWNYIVTKFNKTGQY